MIKNRIIALALTILLLASSTFTVAETSNNYYKGGNGDNQQIITLDGENSDSSVSVRYPSTEVIDASISIEGNPDDDGNYPEGISVDVRNYNWKYQGSGYGALGNQERFSSDSKGASAKFPDSGESELSILLPSNSTITNAEVKISGLPYGSGDLDEYVKACVDSFSKKCEPGIYNLTNVGSITTRQVVEWMKEEGVTEKEFSFFNNEDDFMSKAAITPRSNCVMDTTKSENHGIALRPVEEAVRDSLSKMRMQVSV